MWSADHAKCCSQPTYKHSSLVHWYPQTNQLCSLVKHSFIIALPFGAWQFSLCPSGFSKAPWLQGTQELSCLCLYVTPTCLWPLPGWSVDPKASTYYYIFPTWRKSREEVTSTAFTPFASICSDKDQDLYIYIIDICIYLSGLGLTLTTSRHRGHCELKCLCQLRLCAMPGRTLVAHAGTPRDTEGDPSLPGLPTTYRTRRVTKTSFWEAILFLLWIPGNKFWIRKSSGFENLMRSDSEASMVALRN
jgi:hypothetical protein